MSCPNCNANFNINDKDSYHQVNDITGLTYCSKECSESHLFQAETLPLLVEHFRLDNGVLSKEEVKSEIDTEVFDSSDDQIDQLAEQILSAVKV